MNGSDFLEQCLLKCWHAKKSGWTCPAQCCGLGHGKPCTACVAAKYDSGFYGGSRGDVPTDFECQDFAEIREEPGEILLPENIQMEHRVREINAKRDQALADEETE